MVSEEDIKKIGEYFKDILRNIDKMPEKKRLEKKYKVINFFETIFRDEKEEESSSSKDGIKYVV